MKPTYATTQLMDCLIHSEIKINKNEAARFNDFLEVLEIHNIKRKITEGVSVYHISIGSTTEEPRRI